MEPQTPAEKRAYYGEQFEVLRAFCRDRLGWSVNLIEMPGGTGEMYEEEKALNIAERLRPELRVYTLLHEMGHLKLWLAADFQVRFPYSESFVEQGSKESYRKRNKVGVLEEECAAWDHALLLAIRFGIDVDRTVFDRDKLRSLLTYIRAIDK